MKHILIDTDVILDFFFDRKPYSEAAADIFTLCEQEKLIGYITPVIISNVYYLLRKQASHEVVISKLKSLLQLTRVAILEKQTILVALNSTFTDFEDALQNYAAEQTQQIKIIVTRNIKDFKKSKLSVLTPVELLNAFQ